MDIMSCHVVSLDSLTVLADVQFHKLCQISYTRRYAVQVILTKSQATERRQPKEFLERGRERERERERRGDKRDQRRERERLEEAERLGMQIS